MTPGIGTRAFWGGVSIVGMASLRVALRVLERVAGLMLLDTHAGSERPAARIRYRAMSLVAALLGLRPFSGAIERGMFGPTLRRENSAMVRDWTDRMTRSDPRSMRFTLQALGARDSVTGRLGEIRVPALVLVGEEDDALPLAYSEEMAAGLPDASLVVVPGAVTCPRWSSPRPSQTAILRFLREQGRCS